MIEEGLSELRDGEENRGWIGDSYDMGPDEKPLGSKLWRHRRSAIYDGIEVTIEADVRDALQPLLDVKAAARLDVAVTADRQANKVSYHVSLYGRDGAKIYDNKFELLWDQINGVEYPLSG